MLVECTCNWDAEFSLTEGRYYIVQGVYGENKDKYVLIDDTGISHVWYANRFQEREIPLC